MQKKFLLKPLAIVALLVILAACQERNEGSRSSVSEGSETATVRSEEPKQSIEDSTVESTTSEVFAAGSLLEATTANDLTQVNAILKDKSYSINEVNSQQESALLIATHNNFIEIAKALIDAGADINQQDTISDSPYLYAGAQGKTEILAYMLEKGVPDQTKVNRFGGNALIPAAEKGHLENVKLLLKDGRVAINHQNNFGYTALIEAVALKDGSAIYQEISQVLLEYGADKNLRDNNGLTALDYANRLGYTELQAILNQ